MAELPTDLFRRWTHAHEEDEGDVRVYRPAGYALPPARGRRGIEFKPDGEVLLYGPGPTDRPQASTGHWVAAGARRARVSVPDTGSEQEVEVVAVEPDRLSLRWS